MPKPSSLLLAVKQLNTVRQQGITQHSPIMDKALALQRGEFYLPMEMSLICAGLMVPLSQAAPALAFL